jgi:4-hydroxyphenylacetate 3-monooxygenase
VECEVVESRRSSNRPRQRASASIKVGIVARGAKFETAAAYAKQAFTKPTIANWGDAELSDYAVGFICDLGSPDLKFICRPGFAGRAPIEDYPLASRFDEIDTLVIFDDVLIPWRTSCSIGMQRRQA